jgi:uncharacterized protein (TIGR00299 family) protein
MELKRQRLYFDCFSGVAGDMFLGAALDMGIPERVLREGLSALPLAGYQLVLGRRSHMGIDGCNVHVSVDAAQDHEHDGSCHGHAHHEHDSSHDRHAHHEHDSSHDRHKHRSYRSIREMILRADLSKGARERALDIFARIALAEGKVHRIAAEDVQFHEVGAIDSIVDVVGAALILDYLQPREVRSRPVPLGHGFTRCAHGRMPVPSPAAVEILRGLPVEDGGAELELCTPTGAAIIASAVQSFSELPSGRILAVGYGAGDRELNDRPNHLRLLLLGDDERRNRPEATAADTSLIMIEANLDDMNPEWCPYLLERLLIAGARDAWYTPIVMKKGRPALQLSILADPEKRSAICEILFAESTTLGCRIIPVQRDLLDRELVTVDTVFGAVPLKIGRRGGRELNASPELDVCASLAQRSGRPLKEIFAAAMEAYRRHRALSDD